MIILLLILLSVIVAAGIVALYQTDIFSNTYLPIMLVTILSGMGLFILVVALPVSRLDVNCSIREFHQTEKTIELARQSQEMYMENATLTTKIIELNNWLVNAQYWNEGFWDIYYPDEVGTLKPLR